MLVSFTIGFLFCCLLNFLFSRSGFYDYFNNEGDYDSDGESSFDTDDSSDLDYDFFEQYCFRNMALYVESDSDFEYELPRYTARHSTPIERFMEESNHQDDDDTDDNTIQFLGLQRHQQIMLRNFILNAVMAEQGCQVDINTQHVMTMTDDPRFAEPIPNVTVALGRDASLPCVVENLGNYKVAWIHIDRQMILTIHRHVISRMQRFSVSHDNAKTWLLHVSSVQQEDRGYYMCQVNTNPMISQVGYLQVVVPPNILDSESTQSTVAIRENQNISLTCKADGFPTPKIMWRREDGQPITVERRKKAKVNVYDGEQLNLTRISRTEMGAYLCIATNAVPPSVSKRIIVDVEFSPMIWVPNQLVGAPAGTDVTIDCHTEAYPRAISYWMYENAMLLPSKKYGTETTENSYRAHMKLTVRNMQTKDFGNYRCISKNSLGETEGSIRLYEIPMPSTPPRATEMKSGSNKENGGGKRNVSRVLGQDDRPKVMVSSSDKKDPQAEQTVETGLSVYTPPGPIGSGCIRISKWTHQMAIVTTIHIIVRRPFGLN